MSRDFAGQLAGLKKATAYQELQAYKPSFNLYRVLGIPHRELPHSHMLGCLLEQKELAAFRLDLLLELADRARQKSAENVANMLLSLSADSAPDAHIELGRVDIVLDFGPHNLAIGIENKIWAGEQERQIERYQQFLAARSQSHQQLALIVFLTPLGTRPLTADPSHEVPVVELSWADVARFLQHSADSNDSELRHFIEQTIRHIREDIMQDTPEKRLVRELLGDPVHSKTIRRIVENLPTLADHEAEWAARVQEHLAPTVTPKFEFYRQAGELKEVKVYIKDWLAHELPLCFMLYNYDDEASVRTLVYRDHRHSEILSAFARAHPQLVDETFPELEGWWWHSVLAGDLEAPYRTFSIIDDDFVDSAFDEFVRQFAQLAPTVTAWIEERVN